MNTEEKILHEALDLFSNKGFKASSMREIAQNVGIKASSIYNHFKSKEEILLKLINYYNISHDTITSFNKQDILEKPIEVLKIIAYSIAFIDRSEFELKIKRLLFIEQLRVDIARELLLKKYDLMKYKILPKIFDTLKKEGKIKDYDISIIINQFMGPFFMNRIELTLLDLKNTDKDKIDKHVEFFWNLIKV